MVSIPSYSAVHIIRNPWKRFEGGILKYPFAILYCSNEGEFRNI